MVSGEPDNPGRQIRAAWGAAADAVNEWTKRISDATHEALDKIEPAVRAAVEAGRVTVTGEWRNCRCRCDTSHPDDQGVCDGRAVMTRRLGGSEVSLCAPCAVAQGTAELSD